MVLSRTPVPITRQRNKLIALRPGSRLRRSTASTEAEALAVYVNVLEPRRRTGLSVLCGRVPEEGSEGKANAGHNV
eukprot:170005-Chlamydomonas_euryale.AAC.2